MAFYPFVQKLHEEVIHAMRDLAVCVEEWDPAQTDNATFAAFRFCTACRHLMGDLLQLGEHDLHRCLKTFVHSNPHEPGVPASPLVATWARSEPLDGRPSDPQFQDAHVITENTVWSSLLGEYDGTTRWPNLKFFCSNDLCWPGERFRCSRGKWRDFYRSTLVFPIHVAYDLRPEGRRTLGFLAFDSPKENAFPRMPDVFRHRDNLTEYHNAATGTPIYQLGAVIADCLGMFFHPAWKAAENGS